MITVCFIASNLTKFHFPWKPVIEQAKKIGKIIINADLDSTDDTVNLINSIEGITVIENHWGKPIGKEWLRNQKQAVVDIATTDFILYLDIDELFDDIGCEWLKKIVNMDLLGFDGVRFPYYHFYGDILHRQPDDAGAGWSTKITRLARNPVKFIANSDGFGLAIPDVSVMNSSHRIYHYSHVRPRGEWHKKNRMMFARYDQQYNDLDIDYDSLQLFEGTHPDVIKKHYDFFQQ